MRVLSAHDQRELDAFRRVLSICAWREKELGETHIRAISEACLEVYGDKFGEGDKHHLGCTSEA